MIGQLTSLRTKAFRVITSRLTLAVAASGATALVLGGVAPGIGTQATAVDGQVLDGNVQLVDALETTSYIGLGGFTHTVPGTPKSQSTLPIGGMLTSFNGVTGLFASGTFTFTVFVNNVATPITCTVTAPSRNCSSSATAVIAPGGTLAVRLQNGTSGAVTDVRWTALFQ